MQFERIFTQEDYNIFAKLSGDFNPIHVDEEFSKKTSFGKTVAHGIFLTTCLTGALEKTIGKYNLISSAIMFPAPTFTNITMILDVQIIGENKAKLICKEKQSGQETCVIDVEYELSFPNIIENLNSNQPLIIEPDNNAQKPFFIGQKIEQTRVFSDTDTQIFTKIGGHEIAKNTISPILINAMFSKLLGIDLPGLGTNYLKQETQYLDIGKIGEKIIASVEITRIREDKKIIDFATIAKGEDGRIIATGRALVSARDVIGAFS